MAEVIEAKPVAEVSTSTGAPALPAIDMSKMRASIAVQAVSKATELVSSLTAAQMLGRNLDLIKEDIKRRAQIPEFYEKAIYDKPQGNGKTVTGPSVWLLKQLATMVGHLSTRMTIHGSQDGQTQVTVEVFDKVANNIYELTDSVIHEQWSKDDKKALPMTNPDLIKLKVKSELSKAVRYVLSSAIDTELIRMAEEQCRLSLALSSAAMLKNRPVMLNYFKEHLKVSENQIVRYLKIAGTDKITAEHVRHLRGMIQAIKDGDVDPADIWDGAIAPSKSKNKPAEKSEEAAEESEEVDNTTEQEKEAPAATEAPDTAPEKEPEQAEKPAEEKQMSFEEQLADKPAEEKPAATQRKAEGRARASVDLSRM